MRQIILDTETTGLYHDKGHRVIEIGCVELINRKITGNHFHQYINPERDIEEQALNIHGITSEFLYSKPTFDLIVEDFIDFIKGSELIIHNAPFDIGFLNAELNRLQNKNLLITNFCRIIDTLVMARQIHVGQRNSLDALCKRYGIDNSHRDYHGALLDAHLLAKIFLAMTGGQATLFGDNTSFETQDNFNLHSNQINKVFHSLPILYANQEELTSHNKHLELIEKSGKCLWNSEKVEE